MILRECQRDETVIAYEGATREVFFLISGRVRVTFFSAKGRQITFRDLAPGQMFGELSALDGEPRSSHVVAAEPSTLAYASDEVFRELIADYPDIAFGVIRELTANIRRLTERVVEFSTLNVRSRVRAELLRLAQVDGATTTEETVIEALTHADIASRISTHREAVTREINELIAAGAIVKRGRELVIKSLHGLRLDT